MKAVIRALHSPDVDDLEGWTPPVADDFGFLLQLLVGPSDGPGEESFDVVVCTPKWFAKWIADKPITLGRHYLFVHAYEFERLHDFVRGYVEGVDAPTWDDLAKRIGRLGRWEFEDYQPFRS